MSDPIRFLVSFGQAVSTMALYNEGHPARERAVESTTASLGQSHRAELYARGQAMTTEEALAYATDAVTRFLSEQ